MQSSVEATRLANPSTSMCKHLGDFDPGGLCVFEVTLPFAKWGAVRCSVSESGSGFGGARKAVTDMLEVEKGSVCGMFEVKCCRCKQVTEMGKARKCV